MAEFGERTGGEAASTAAVRKSWVAWVLRWFAAMAAVMYVALAIYLAVDSGRPLTVLLLVVWVPLLALVVGAMALVASGLRWALARLAPRALKDAIGAVVALGGGAASYLAERRISPRRPAWWVAVLGAALLGLLLLEPVRGLFPTYGSGLG